MTGESAPREIPKGSEAEERGDTCNTPLFIV
jgi:hypothetical protein